MLPLADTAKQRRPAVVTGLLVAANLGVFGWEVWLGYAGSERLLAGFVTEHALVAHPAVAEAAVVGASDATTGQAIVAFVTLRLDAVVDDDLVESLRLHVGQMIGPIAKPRQVLITPELPKTRSGKIIRRLLRDVAEQRTLGDTTTLVDPAVVAMIDELMRSAPADD